MKAYFFPSALLIAASSAFAGQQVDQRLAAAARGTVEIANVAGTVTVQGTSKNEVQVSGNISERARLEFTVEGDRTVVKVVLPKTSWHDSGSELSIQVPEGSAVTTSTVSADTVIQDVRGALDLQTVSGNLEAETYDRDAKLRSVSGDVTVHGNHGTAVLGITTVSGNIEVKNAAGEMNAQTVSGDLNLHLSKLVRSRLRTTSGDINLYGELTSDARVESETVSGDINLYLAGARDGDYDLATATGDISNCFGPRAVEHKYGPGMELKFRQGTSDASLKARTLSGDLSLCKD